MAECPRSISSLSTIPAGDKGNNSTIDWHDIPVLALGPTVRNKLSLYLNRELDTAKDWRYLAEILDYETLDIQNWERRRDPTRELLNNWGSKRGSSVGKLLDNIHLIEREDVIEDIGLLIESDVTKWVRKREEERRNVQDPEVSSVSPNFSQDEFSRITIQDNEDDSQKFDAFVCYCLDDHPFVQEMISVLEGKEKLKLYIQHRDLLPGGSHTTVTAELIENRCRRMVVVLSPQFKEDDFNNFCIKFGISLQPGGQSKKVIPVIVAPCKLPSILQHLTVLDYTKKDLRPWFWNRLSSAIKFKL
ncbi:myeloid differentiation primary response protein MyD88-A-like [Apostichopus japonicus]|uniref:myeloid differentiation primary response protein MyD88-A-like n=1 Tax=Stichopus japonicus TaxID=307972 RepID=UPI003AB52A3A